ncbi:hypothetical protein [Amycolatopsis sp. NPDC051372]|uniref:hypothetical protein n=1 Tax=Amycolatopsis sp. NPDC051372 TaxID=3155669 RepID=UPI003419DFA7
MTGPRSYPTEAVAEVSNLSKPPVMDTRSATYAAELADITGITVVGVEHGCGAGAA